MDLINSFTSDVVHKALDGFAARQKSLSSNLANVDTPGYRRKDVQFENALESAIAKHRQGDTQRKQASNNQKLAMTASNSSHFALNAQPNSVSEVTPQMVESEGMQTRNDGNAVDLESEMAMMAKNTQRYIALNNLQSRSQRSIKGIIQG